MVQFGGGLSSGGSVIGGRNQAFRTVRPPRFNLRNLLLLLIVLFVLRNLFLTTTSSDYQREENKNLRNVGTNPKTGKEREDGDLEKIKKDIAYLLKEVEELKAGGRSGKENPPDAQRGESLRSMDGIHEEKRRMKEEQLLKDHPDFKPSKRLKDLLTDSQLEPKTE